MADGKFVAYFRVSTSRQGKSGLGLAAQEAAVRERLNGGQWEIVGSFTEVETGTNKKARPELEKALAYCRVMGARLIVSHVSRLTRDPDFIGKLVAAKVEVVFCDLPKVEGPVGTFMLRQMLAVAELEAGMISERTKKALAEAKKRNVKLGGDRGNLPAVSAKGRANSIVVRQERARGRAADLAGIIAELQASGLTSLRQLAHGLNQRNIPTARGGQWSAVQVDRVMKLIQHA